MNLIRVYYFEDFDRGKMISAFRLPGKDFITALEMLNLFKEIVIEDTKYKIISFDPTCGDEDEHCNCVDVMVDEKYAD